ncbi:putative Hybrid PKS-NRPS biosynthetic cluster [Paecilomyces lecythidis]
MSPPQEPIAIIGSGCRFPGDASSPSKLWELLRRRRDVSRKIDRFNVQGFYHHDGHHHGASNVTDAYLLSEDPRAFDAQFFGIQAGEADAIDPQQRLLLETVYESLELAGLPLEEIRGSNTAVYVGVMCDDYGGIVYQDSEAIPTYAATGIARSILSNRVSYIFDLHGPSMTIDTACSSSLVAVHQAVQVLRARTSKVAIAAGANLIFGPNMFISETNLNMLSPTGKSQMWDANANGYARGEGTAAVVMKLLSDAVVDGDCIECIIRETGVNQDGHTTGITMPSQAAQMKLIQETYMRAGLDLRNPDDRCQYFEAHGTGTKAGDSVESKAIYNAFFNMEHGNMSDEKLFVGSIKTVIGHTEGTAGLAGILKASLAVQNGVIPPNLHFKELNPEIAPYYGKIRIPTEPQEWPPLPKYAVRRASVNSFGFGGTNAHAIIEGYDPKYHGYGAPSPQFETGGSPVNTLPLTLSATSEKTLSNLICQYLDHFRDNPDEDLRRIAWTLHYRRSLFPVRTSFAASSVNSLVPKLQSALDDKSTYLTRRKPESKHLLGVFTGQGAQWATMGSDLIAASPFAEQVIERLEEALAGLPVADRPPWSLREQILASAVESRISEGEISQPLCTAIQILLVDILKQANITFHAVIGHSSGEIGAAYAAGFLNATDAIRIAYYRGRYAHLAHGPQGQRGAMLAAGTTVEDVQELCELPAFEGRVVMAACNSSSSVTLSGDTDAIDWVKEVLEDEHKFNRKLKVDTAYHSHHMAPCSTPYQKSLGVCRISVQHSNGSCRWYSSVHNGQMMDTCDELKDQYWVKNMVNPVLFSQALEAALTHSPTPTMAIEVGPHPALKGPATSVIEEVLGASIPYIGTLVRGQDGLDALASTVGSISDHFGRSAVDFRSYDRLFGQKEDPLLLQTLPSYPWDHDRLFWFESRESKSHRFRDNPPHPLLGVRLSTSNEHEYRWRNYLIPNEIPWLNGHKIQGQTLFPAAGFLIMAIEAARSVAADKSKSLKVVELIDFKIHRALGFYDDEKGVEVLATLSNLTINSADDGTTAVNADFTCDTCPQKDIGSFFSVASGTVRLLLGKSSSSILIDRPDIDASMIDVDVDMFYSSLEMLGYNYSGLFRSITSLRRATDVARGEILAAKTGDRPDSTSEDFLLHPAALDVAFQAIFAAVSYPGDGALWTLHIPTTIRRVTINPAGGPRNGGLKVPLDFSANSQISSNGKISGDVDIFPHDGQNALCQVEGLEVTPLSPPTEKDDRQMFAESLQYIASPDADAVFKPVLTTSEEQIEAMQVERLSLYCLRKLLGSTVNNPGLRIWAQRVVDTIALGEHPTCRHEWLLDTWDDVESALRAIHPHSIYQTDVRRIKALGVAFEQTGDIELSPPLNSLHDFYESSFGVSQSREHLACLAFQVTRRYPQTSILELQTGNGSATRTIIDYIGNSFSTYTCSGLAEGVFDDLNEAFGSSDRTSFLTKISLEEDLQAQGFSGGSYDLIIAPNGIHGVKDYFQVLRNIRFLLKPGGYLLALQVTNPDSLRVGLTLGALDMLPERPRNDGTPFLHLSEWDALLRGTGFSGVDTSTPDTLIPFSAFATQAVDAQINAMRHPIESSGIAIDHLLIIGGQRFPISRTVRELQELLGPFSKRITTIKSLDELQTSNLLPRPLVLSVTELDSPFFLPLTRRKFQALQKLFDRCKTVLWAVEGANGESPHGNMMKGLVRCLLPEMPHIFAQIFNFDPSSAVKDRSRILVQAVLRLHIANTWRDNYSSLWSIERELTINHGKVYITRYIPNEFLNRGYNATRRRVTSNTSLQDRTVALVKDQNSYTLQQYRVTPIPRYPLETELCTIRIQYSILCSLKIEDLGYFYLCSGIDEESNSCVLAISEQQQSVLKIPRTRIVSFDLPQEHRRNLLISVAGVLLANSITEKNGTSSAIIMHEPPPLLARFVAQRTVQRGIHVIFTTAKRDTAVQNKWTYIDPYTPDRHLRKLAFNKVSVFIGCSEDAVQSRIVAHLPIGVYQLTIDNFFKSSSLVYPGTTEEKIRKILLDAYNQASSFNISDESLITQEDIMLHDVARQPVTAGHNIQVVNWTSTTPVSTQVIPATEEITFSEHKTYFLIGMTGNLGLSTCLYMISRGAKYFALASRNPKVDQKWLSDISLTYGATIKVFALDITKRDSVMEVYQTISRTMPPIGGVTNAALIMRDGAFMDMDSDDMNQALQPKVDGSIYLDELFSHDKDLEFFILFSSLVYVTGNAGQVAYAAGNAFMVSLTHGRRQRGLVGSVMNLSGIKGVGYITRTDHGILNRLDILGYGVMSERDFLYFFAEAILAGPPNSGRNPEVSAGVRFCDPHKDAALPVWIEDPKFSHYRVSHNQTDHQENGNQAMSVKNRLLGAQSEREAFDIILDALLAMLHRKLRLPPENSVPADVAIVELGVDSLVAVEMRSWFTNEFNLDIPVIKILGGATVSGLVSDAILELSREIIPSVAKDVPTEKSDTIFPLVHKGSDSGSGSLGASELDSNSTVNESTDTSTSIPDVDEKATSLVFQRKERMSYGSSRFWFLRHYLDDETCFNIVFRARITGKIDIKKFEDVVRQIGNRHEAFRTSFYADKERQDEPTQGVLEESSLQLEVNSITHEDEALSVTNDLLRYSFDIENGETIRMLMLSLSPEDHILVFGMHHIAIDGFSFNIILTEIDLLYRGQSLPVIRRQFTDFAVEQRREVENGRMDRERAFWRNMYPDIPEPLPLFPFATVSSRKPVMRYEHEEVAITLDRATAEIIRARCRENRSTIFHFFLATLQVFLFRYLDIDDLCIGIADANRHDVNTLGTVGFLLNLLPLRFSAANGAFDDVLSAARNLVYSCLEHSRFPFDVLIEDLNIPRSSTYSPLFQVLLDYRQFAVKSPPMLNCRAEGERIMGRTAYDLLLDITDFSGSDISIKLQTQKSLYSRQHTEVLLHTYMHLVHLFANDFKAETSTAPLFSENEERISICHGRGPTFTSEWLQTLSHRIDYISSQYSDDIALRDGLGASMTYRDMSLKSDAIIDQLRQAGIEPGSKVAVFQEPSALWICSLLAIWKIGAIYLPLDNRNGLARLASIVDKCKPDAMLCTTTTLAHTSSLGYHGPIIDVRITMRDSLIIHWTNKAVGSSTAVILFTSGSTGSPKGIEISHFSLRNLFEGYYKMGDLSRHNVLQQSAYSFDLSLDQIFTGLTSGGSIYIASTEQRLDPHELSRIISQEHITSTTATPSEYSSWINYGKSMLSSAEEWNRAIIAGERWTSGLQNAFRSLQLPGLRLLSCYGPAETTIYCTKMDLLLEDTGAIPVGHPIPNSSIYVVDSQLKVLPAGVVGEIVVGGAGVAMGYFDNVELTESKFFTDPYASPEFISAGWSKAYRTGDMGYLQEDGSLVFKGRIDGDTQVKLRGIRIELEDIENTIVKTSGGVISRAVVSVRGESNESQILIAFVDFASGCSLDQEGLSRLLSRLPLPQYMIPTMLVPLDEGIPLTPHKKVNRLAIHNMPLPQENHVDDKQDILSPTEVTLREVWMQILPAEITTTVPIGKRTDFFYVGGNSLMSVRLQARIRDAFGVFLPLVDLMESSTLEEIAIHIENQLKEQKISWDAEIAIDQDILSIHPREAKRNSSPSQTVLLTGASGFVGSSILRQLISDDRVSRIHCVAVREGAAREKVDSMTAATSKVIIHEGDLTYPRLGLPEDTFLSLSSETDVIIHSGANRSFWGRYDSLRAVNVLSTKELVRLAAYARRDHGKVIPIHFLSTSRNSYSNEDFIPPTDGSMGYAASKWASERYLQNAAAQHLGLPVYIHQTAASISMNEAEKYKTPEQENAEKERVFDEFTSIISQIRLIPSPHTWGGHWDLVPLRQFTGDIVEEAVGSQIDIATNLGNGQEYPLVRYKTHFSTVRMTMDEVVQRLEKEMNGRDSSTGGETTFEEIPAHIWVGKAKSAGFSYHFASMDMFLLKDGNGEVVGELRR